MKKQVLFALGFCSGLSLMAQEKVYPTFVGEAANSQQSAKTATINDTLVQPVYGTNDSCDVRLFSYANQAGQSVTGNYPLSNGSNIVKVSQVLNTGNESVDVEGILTLVSLKEEGPSKGSFTAMVYDTTNGISANPLGTSDPISFDNIDTSGNGVNVFNFSNPVAIDHVFWATIAVDNSSDTLAVYSTNDDCGNGTAIFQTSDGSWSSYAQSFTVASGDPLDVSLWIWALVDSTGGNVGLDRHLISADGIASYPNPTTGKTTIEFEMHQENSYTLLVQSLSGTVVREARKTFVGAERKFEVDLSDLPEGPYTFQVIGRNEQRNGVLIKK
jgi:hypothetical protein